MEFSIKASSGSKYLRPICPATEGPRIEVDVYCVLAAFNVTNPGLQHCIKKLLCAGLRGKGDLLTDLIQAKDALNRAIELEQNRQRDQELDQ